MVAFAGEHCHPSFYSTGHGAYLSGRSAAQYFMAVASAAAIAKEDDEEVYNLVTISVLLKFSPIALEYNNRVFLILFIKICLLSSIGSVQRVRRVWPISRRGCRRCQWVKKISKITRRIADVAMTEN